jgi:hypothetical protein
MASPAFRSSNPTALFLFYDMGGIQPFTDVVTKKLPELGIDPYVIALGTAAERAEGLGFDRKQIIYLKDVGVETDISVTEWLRAKRLPNNEVSRVVEKVRNLNPQLILTGTHSYVQFQLVEAIADQCRLQDRKFAYYDTHHTPFERHADGLMTLFSHNNYHLLVANTLIAKPIFETKVTVVGHPLLEKTVEETTFARRTREEIFQKLKLSKKDKVIVYIGGYAEGYEDSVCLFLDIVRWLREHGRPNLQVIIRIHPKFTSLPMEEITEYKLVQEKGVPNISIVVEEAKTSELIAIASLVVSCFSTVVPYAIAAGTSGHFINAHPDKIAGNVMIDRGIFRNLQTPEEVMAALDEKLPDQDFFSLSETPRDSVTNLTNIVKDSIIPV